MSSICASVWTRLSAACPSPGISLWCAAITAAFHTGMLLLPTHTHTLPQCLLPVHGAATVWNLWLGEKRWWPHSPWRLELWIILFSAWSAVSQEWEAKQERFETVWNQTFIEIKYKYMFLLLVLVILQQKKRSLGGGTKSKQVWMKKKCEKSKTHRECGGGLLMTRKKHKKKTPL